MNCRRCGRTLTDPQSISRQYGPTCWQKTHTEYERDYQSWLIEHTSITDAALAAKTRKEVGIRALKHVSGRTCTCGEPLEHSTVLMFDHDDGVRLNGFGQPQWIFLRCPECQHEIAYAKLRAPSLDDLAPPKLPEEPQP